MTEPVALRQRDQPSMYITALQNIIDAECQPLEVGSVALPVRLFEHTWNELKRLLINHVDFPMPRSFDFLGVEIKISDNHLVKVHYRVPHDLGFDRGPV